MSNRSGIVAAGNWIVDKLKSVDMYPQQDALANILDQSIGNGGSPFNILMDLSRLDSKFPLAGVGLIGADADGRWILEQCKLQKIDVSRLRTHSTASTSYTDVMIVKSSGRRTFFHQRGANAFLGPEHFDFSSATGKIFHLGYLLLLDRLDQPDPEFGTAAGRVFHLARLAGFKTSVDIVSEDSHRFSQVVLPTLPQIDYCILNEFELERTSGIFTRQEGRIDLGAIHHAAEKLIQAGVREYVIVHFPEGACALDTAGNFAVEGSIRMPPERIVSTVGAGDAFAAGVLLGLHDEINIATALRYGIAASASCLFGQGTSDSIRPMSDCLQIGQNFGLRELS